jgi:hypothetical protein
MLVGHWLALSSSTPFQFFQVEATDFDSGENGKITYSIVSSTTPGLLNIDSNGAVTLQGSLNFKVEASYTLTVMAKDNGSPSLNTTVVLKIFVTDINERPCMYIYFNKLSKNSEYFVNSNTGFFVGFFLSHRIA